MSTNPLNDIDAVLDGFVNHLKNDQFISNTQAQVLRFDSVSTFKDAEDAARLTPGFAYVVGAESTTHDAMGAEIPPFLRFRVFVSCLHSGLFTTEIAPLAAAKLPGNVHFTKFLANGRQVSVFLSSNAVDLMATIPCMEYQLQFELIIN